MSARGRIRARTSGRFALRRAGRAALDAVVSGRRSGARHRGREPYFLLTPGLQLTLQGSEGGKGTVLVITVLAETEMVGGVETRVVEERETAGGALVEVSRNFFAIHPSTKDVYYFGEDVDIYKNGKVQSHEGAWRHRIEQRALRAHDARRAPVVGCGTIRSWRRRSRWIGWKS